MSIEADIAAFNTKLDAAIETAMKNDVALVARDCIIAVLDDCVYDKYTPHGKNPYERRRSNGGLEDFRNVEMVDCGPTPNGYQIELRDLAEGIDGEGPIDQIIETGVGYTWTESDIYAERPYPRPFYEAAEKMAVNDGYVEKALKRALTDAGFKF